MRRSAFALLLTTTLLTSNLFAAHRETTTVEVVQVPVYVSVDGKALTGLTRTDFELYVNGKPQPFDYFDVIDFAGLPAEAKSDPRQRRMYLLTFDMLFSSPNSLYRAQAAAEKYLGRALPGDVFAVAKYTSNHGLEFIIPFTRDRALVHSALASLSSSRAGDPLQLTITSNAPATLNDAERDAGSTARNADMRTDLTIQQAARDAALQPRRVLVGDEIADLTDLADRMALLEGQKHVVLFSAGFDSSLIHGVETRRNDQQLVRIGPVASLSPYANQSVFSTVVSSAGEPGLSGAVRGLAKHYNAAGVFLDAVDILGLRPNQTAADNESLFTLTRDTGGIVIEHENDLTNAIQVLTDQQRVAYVLGFRPQAGSRSTNSIRVEVRNAPHNADLVYRPSYSTQVPLPASNDALRLADILMNDIPQNGLNLTATTTSQGGHAVVNLDIFTRELLALSDGKNVEAEALMYVYSGNSVVAFQQKRITVEASRVDPGKPVRVTQEFDLPNGTYVAKVLVRYDDQLGFARNDFVIGQ